MIGSLLSRRGVPSHRPRLRSTIVLGFLALAAAALVALPWTVMSAASSGVLAQLSARVGGGAGAVALYGDQVVLARIQSARDVGRRDDVVAAVAGRTADPTEVLATVGNALTGQLATALAGSDGTVIATSDPALIPARGLPSAWTTGVSAGNANGAVVRVGDAPALVLVTPVQTPSGQVVGMLETVSDLSDYVAQVKRYSSTEGLALLVVDGSGKVIARAGDGSDLLQQKRQLAQIGSATHAETPGGPLTLTETQSGVVGWHTYAGALDATALTSLAGLRITVILITVALALLFLVAGNVVRLAMGNQERAYASLRASNLRLSWVAHHDALTHLANRLLFTRELERMATSPERGVVLLLDMNGFKRVNDALGHAAGDALLVEVARRLERAVREDDTVARLGGDEFGIILPGADDELAGRLIGRIAAAVSQPLVLEQQPLRPSVSIGSALVRDGESPDQLLKRADQTMYDLKRARLATDTPA